MKFTKLLPSLFLLQAVTVVLVAALELPAVARGEYGRAVAAILLLALAASLTAAWLSRRFALGFDAWRQQQPPLARRRPDADRPPSPAASETDAFTEAAWKLRVELHQHNAALERSNADLRKMLQTIPEGVIAIDVASTVLFANPSVYRLFGKSPFLEHVPGLRLSDIATTPTLHEAVRAAFARHEPYNTEFEIGAPPRILAFRGRPLTVESGRAVIIVLHDLTELRRLERIRQEFLANVSHELKTPLAAIKAFTETLLDNGVHEPAVMTRFLKRIEEQAERLHTLVLDMLMLARTESRDHGFVPQRVDAREHAASVAESFRAEAERKGIALAIDRGAEPCPVVADPEGLQMILRNLIDNAIKYTPAGGAVTVSSRLDGAQVALAVADTGVGIPHEDLGRVFERFYRVDKARSRAMGGTGLGLSIVKHMTQNFGGSVAVESRLDEGSTFTVRLPLATGNASSSGPDSNVDLALFAVPA